MTPAKSVDEVVRVIEAAGFVDVRALDLSGIDDAEGQTLVAASSREPDVLARLAEDKTKTDKAKLVGLIVGERAKAAGIDTVVFDRGGYKYHGRVKAVAEGARESGLTF